MSITVKYSSDMKIILAIECGGHPLWQRNKYDFVMINTSTETATNLTFYKFFDEKDKDWRNGEVEYYIRANGVFARFFSCGSGYGKVPRGDEFLLIGKEDYDKVIVLASAEKREAERNYNGSWQDNSDFE